MLLIFWLKFKVQDDASCNKWTLCINGVALPQECDAGTLFNPAIGNCDFAQNVRCDFNSCARVNDGFVANPTDCSMYYICSSGETVLSGRCPSGLQFDHLTLKCTITATCFPGTGLITI